MQKNSVLCNTLDTKTPWKSPPTPRVQLGVSGPFLLTKPPNNCLASPVQILSGVDLDGDLGTQDLAFCAQNEIFKMIGKSIRKLKEGVKKSQKNYYRVTRRNLFM